ncbi:MULTISPECIES: FecR domain-containing protein [unclassified Bradyrhizobium]|uniref:FecR family protein n=1 Tax=unclassified Bradyrhizobium TaxID=2631580 RepID=UPI0028E8AA80|nr:MULTISPECIES: FecR domain-containing protein [unclassified Bradyrhizobium]
MSLRRRTCVAAISAAALLGVAGGASADSRIGEAVLVQKDVLRVAGASSSPISVGDGVVRNETVRTGNDSAARLVMIDSTNLSLGANATLTLDRTVFNDETSYRDIAIRLGTGAFRFVTGHSEKTAYKINTPLATIGVRGTILDIRSQRGQTMVVLQEGASRVCTLTFQCLELTQPGDTAIITATGQGRSAIKKTGNPSWSFAATCASTSGLCTVTDLASNAPPQDFTGILCGR